MYHMKIFNMKFMFIPILKKVLEDINKGEYITHKEAMERLKKWLK